MHVQPQCAREERLRDQQAIRGDDNGVGGHVDGFVETGRLLHRDAKPLGDFLCGGRLQGAAAAARLVGAREQQRDVVLLREPLEHVGAERRGGRDGDPRH